MSIMKKDKKEDAVSPVVGVMLMLVVTIIIAAVVAAFASGVATDTEASSNVIIKLDDYDMATVYYTGSGPYAFAGMNSNPGGDATPNYAVYNMTFIHKGGDRLFIDDLRLAITYNAATYYTPISAINTEVKEWSVGQKLYLTLGPDKIKDMTGGLLLGLSQQNMDKYGGNSFEWALLDNSGNVIAKGTESARL